MICLTDHQRKVLELISQGYVAKEVGAILGISGKTVGALLTKMRRRAGARNTPHLIRVTIEKGELPCSA